jgi:electron transfer flavoprotein beta subunit
MGQLFEIGKEMRIIVAIKQILDPACFDVDRKFGRINVKEQRMVINPADKCALEAALAIKGRDSAEIILVSLGLENAADVLREGLAMGADQAILFCDDSFQKIDESGVVKVLAALVNVIGNIDLILLGQAALDTNGAQVGPRLAQALNWTFLGNSVQVDCEKQNLQIIKAADGGYIQLETNLPAVVTVNRGGPHPRYPRGPELIAAHRNPKAVEQWTLSDLEIPADVLARRSIGMGLSFPAEKEPWVTSGGDLDEIVALLASELRSA